jgi:hypothetical protein
MFRNGLLAASSIAALMLCMPAMAQTPSTHGLFDTGAGANPGIGSVTAAQIGATAFAATGATAARTSADRAADIVNVRDFGARGDLQLYAGTYSITSGAAVLSASASVFAASMVGKTVIIGGAGASGAALITTISGFTDTQHVTLAAPAGTTISAVSLNLPVGTDDTAAFAAATAAAKLHVGSIGSGSVYTGEVSVPGSSGMYLLLGGWNLAGIQKSGFRVSGAATLYGANAGGAVVDMLGSAWVKLRGLTIRGDAYSVPRVGLQRGRTDSTANNSSDNLVLQDVFIGGTYSLTGFLDEQAETSPIYSMQVYVSAPYAGIYDGYNHFAATSPFITNNEAVDTAQSFNEASCENCIFSTSLTTGSPLWIGHVSRMEIGGKSYAIGYGNAGAVLYTESSGGSTILDLDLHFETSLAHVFQFDAPASGATGATTAATLYGLHWQDQEPFISGSVFSVSPNVSTVSLPDADITMAVADTGAVTEFDTPADYTMTGRNRVPTAVYNGAAGTFSGLLSLSGVQQIVGNTTFNALLPTSYTTAGLASDGITISEYVGTIAPAVRGYYYTSASGAYTPTVTLSAPATGGTQATAHIATYGTGGGTLASGGAAADGYVTGNYPLYDQLGNQIFSVSVVASGGVITSITGPVAGTSTALVLPNGQIPANPLKIGTGTATLGNVTFYPTAITVDNPGSGYASAATATLSSAHASPTPTATASMGSSLTMASIATGTLLAGGAETHGGTETHNGLATFANARLAGGTVSAQSGAYTLAATDCGTTIRDTGAAAHTDTVPTGLPIGCRISILQTGAGAVTAAAGTGVTPTYSSGSVAAATTANVGATVKVFIDTASTAIIGTVTP